MENREGWEVRKEVVYRYEPNDLLNLVPIITSHPYHPINHYFPPLTPVP